MSCCLYRVSYTPPPRPAQNEKSGVWVKENCFSPTLGHIISFASLLFRRYYAISARVHRQVGQRTVGCIHTLVLLPFLSHTNSKTNDSFVRCHHKVIFVRRMRVRLWLLKLISVIIGWAHIILLNMGEVDMIPAGISMIPRLMPPLLRQVLQ